jgi:tetratricopeptide (TPR) repeat protein
LEIELMNCFENGRQLMSEGLNKEAIQAFEHCIDMNIESAQAFFNRGVCHYRLGNYRQAKDDLEAATLLGCKDASLWSKFQSKKQGTVKHP